MEKVDFVFILLHYTALNDTLECVESIQKYADGSYKIVIVDNASPDNSGIELEKKYKNSEDVYVLISHENRGFARGNNYGIEFALKNYQFSYCVVMNNDTLVIEDGLRAKLDSEYKKSSFAVLGPMILTADGYADSNPVSNNIVDYDYIVNSIDSEQRHLLAEANIFLRAIRNMWFWIKPLFRQEAHQRKNFIKKQYDVMLHGAVLIFSQDYFHEFQGFYPKTFLFHEEEILHLLVMKRGLHTVYDPDIHFYHKEDASTNNVYKSTHERRLAKFTYSVQSLNVLKDLYEELN